MNNTSDQNYVHFLEGRPISIVAWMLQVSDSEQQDFENKSVGHFFNDTITTCFCFYSQTSYNFHNESCDMPKLLRFSMHLILSEYEKERYDTSKYAIYEQRYQHK